MHYNTPKSKRQAKRIAFCLPFLTLKKSEHPSGLKAAHGIVAREFGDHDAGRGVLRVDEHPVAEVDADVPDIARPGVEAEDVAGLEL